MGTAAKLAFLVIALAFFMGCAGAGSGAGGSANGVQYYSATCYQPSYVGTGTSAYPVSPSVSPTREGHPTYWCTNPPKVTTTPTPSPSPSPGTTH